MQNLMCLRTETESSYKDTSSGSFLFIEIGISLLLYNHPIHLSKIGFTVIPNKLSWLEMAPIYWAKIFLGLKKFLGA
jgi:hypothetical protein